MNRTEFEVLTVAAYDVLHDEPRVVRASDLQDATPRTLAYGYTCDRETFHVYLSADGIHKVIYVDDKPRMHKHEGAGLLLTECVPDKRLYPETCDFEFCDLLMSRGVRPPFTTWNDLRAPQLYYGKLLEELTTAEAA